MTALFFYFRQYGFRWQATFGASLLERPISVAAEVEFMTIENSGRRWVLYRQLSKCGMWVRNHVIQSPAT
jgi:hypothetical protein